MNWAFVGMKYEYDYINTYVQIKPVGKLGIGLLETVFEYVLMSLWLMYLQ